MKIQNRKLSTYSIIICVLVVSILMFSSKGWRQEKQVIYWDVISYYAYLPATFIFDDIRLEKKETFANGIFWPEKSPNGGNVIKTTMGMSILYAPSFFVGHLFAKLFGYPAYGYSAPYKIALLVGALFYLVLGLIFLRKILLSLFSDNITALTILAVVLGTNLTYYASREATMSHLYSFTLISIFVWLTILWHKLPKLTSLIWVGALAGLISLVRPTNVIILVFFFLYDVKSWQSISQKFQFFFRHFHWLLLMFLAFLLVWMPQFVYWKAITGNFLYYSYTKETFFFGNPQILNGLFSYRKGWFIYTPMMFLAVIGVPFLYRKMKELSWAVSAFIVLNTYVVLSWWCWWYGGGFGQRAMIDSYLILAIPFAVLLTTARQSGKYLYSTLRIITVILILHNQFEIEQYKYGSINYDGMTKEAYWNSFGKLRPKSDFWPLLKAPDYEKAIKGENEY